MEMSRDIGSVIEKRQIIYAFLKRIYEEELSKELLSEMPAKMKLLLPVIEILSHSRARKAVKNWFNLRISSAHII